MRTRVKICGLMRRQDALAAVRLGADALGFVFFKKSPRSVAPQVAAHIIRTLPPFVCPVGLFVDPDASEVEKVLSEVPLAMLQFHGDETPAFCASFGMPYIKAVRVRPELDLVQYAALFPDAAGLLLDAYVAGTHGGTGKTFDWGLIPERMPMPIVLSGGLSVANVAEGIRRVRPWAVDVSSGVEAAKGIKDEAKIAAFMQGVHDAGV